MKLNSCYICVKDMSRAIQFYTEWLNISVDKQDKTFSIFIISGFRLCLFNPESVGEKVTYGDNCLLSFEVDDIHMEIDRLISMKRKIVYPITKIGRNLVAEFKDTEGNDIEIYQKIIN